MEVTNVVDDEKRDDVLAAFKKSIESEKLKRFINKQEVDAQWRIRTRTAGLDYELNRGLLPWKTKPLKAIENRPAEKLAKGKTKGMKGKGGASL